MAGCRTYGIESERSYERGTMETWDAIRTRRNVRSYQDRPIEEDALNRILEAGRRTPSSRNQQRWDLVVVTDRKRLNKLAKVWRGGGHVARSAATIALIAPESSDPSVRDSIHYDLGQLTMSIILAATDLGVGAGHSSVKKHKLAKRLLELPDGSYCAWLIALGYPNKPLRPVNKPARREFDDVVHREVW